MQGPVPLDGRAGREADSLALVAAFKEGEVVRVVEEADDLVRVTVTVDGSEIAAVGYPFMLGRVRTGDRVIVNTTGIDLGLGTGGAGFVLWNLDGPAPPGPRAGTHRQASLHALADRGASVEAPESPHHARLETVESIEGMPVVTAACTLRSPRSLPASRRPNPGPASGTS